MEEVPVISLARYYGDDPAGLAATAAAVDRALRTIGFFVVTDHRVEPLLIDRTIAEVRAFFDLPAGEKLVVHNNAYGSARGYQPVGELTLARTLGVETPPDLIERFGVGPAAIPVVGEATRHLYAPNLWPAGRDGFRTTLEAYYRAVEGLSFDLLHILSTALRMPPDYLRSRFAGHNSTLRLNNYPALQGPAEPGQMRAGTHTDYGALTVLLADDAPGGLQVKSRTGGRWLDIRPPRYAYIINVGDMLMSWTNDVWVSNLHRVLPPDQGETRDTRRMSFAFFFNPREDVLLECIPTCTDADRPPKYPPILAGKSRLRKIQAAHGQHPEPA